MIEDIGSGLNTNRRGLRKLIELARKRQIDAIMVAFKDRQLDLDLSILKNYSKPMEYQ